jgi:hypothetical protein
MAGKGRTDKIGQTVTEPENKDFKGSGVEGHKGATNKEDRTNG